MDNEEYSEDEKVLLEFIGRVHSQMDQVYQSINKIVKDLFGIG